MSHCRDQANASEGVRLLYPLPKATPLLRDYLTNLHLVRHIKCDERKPCCIRCTSTGRKCDGYAPLEKSKERKQPSVTSSGHCSIIHQRNPNIEIFGDQAERRSFCFFRDRTAPQLAGLFASEFWDCLLPLSAHHQPAIRHAVVALSALHERFENNDNSILSSNSDVAQGGFALQQYNCAIGCLIKSVKDGEDQSVDVALIACILFACFEVLYHVVATFWALRLEAYKYAHCQ